MTSGVPVDEGGKLVRCLARISSNSRSYICGVVDFVVTQLNCDKAQYRILCNLGRSNAQEMKFGGKESECYVSLCHRIEVKTRSGGQTGRDRRRGVPR
jgi:hypothetical protein